MKRDKLSTTRCIPGEHGRDRSVQRDKEAPIKMQFRSEGRVEKKRAHTEAQWSQIPPLPAAQLLLLPPLSVRIQQTPVGSSCPQTLWDPWHGAESPADAMLDKSEVLIMTPRAVFPRRDNLQIKPICDFGVSPSALTYGFKVAFTALCDTASYFLLIDVFTFFLVVFAFFSHLNGTTSLVKSSWMQTSIHWLPLVHIRRQRHLPAITTANNQECTLFPLITLWSTLWKEIDLMQPSSSARYKGTSEGDNSPQML